MGEMIQLGKIVSSEQIYEIGNPENPEK